MHFHVIAGLAVASEIPLAGPIDAEPGSDKGEAVTVRLGPVPETLAEPCQLGPNWAVKEGQFLLAIPGIARFLLTDGRDVAVEPAPRRLPVETAIFITETILGIVMQQRGRVVLRASAVALGSRAILLCGPPGAGKSTLAAALDQAGYPLLCDDLCAIEIRPSLPALAHREGGNLKLWAEALDALGLRAGALGAVRGGVEKYSVAASRQPPGQALPVAAVYQLRENRQAGAPAIEALGGMPAVRMLSDSAYRPPLVAAMGRNALYFDGAAALARDARAFVLARRFDLARLADGVEALEAHWTASGLMEDGR